MIIYSNRIKIFAIILLTLFINNCQTFDAGYGPGNTQNSLLVIIDEGIVELKMYSKTTEYKDINDNRAHDKRKPNPGMWEILYGVIDAVLEEELDTITLTAGNQYSYYLKPGETATLKIKPIKDGENDKPVEITIKYHGRERKFKLKTNIISKSFSYIGG